MAHDLESCPNLRSLELELTRGDSAVTRSGCDFFLMFLSRLPTSLLQLALHFNSVQPYRLWEEGAEGVPPMNWKQVEAALSGSKSLQTVILDFHNVTAYQSRTPRFKIDDITRLFSLQTPLLAAMKIFQLRVNTVLFGLSDGASISKEGNLRCTQKGCWRHVSNFRMIGSGWQFDVA